LLFGLSAWGFRKAVFGANLLADDQKSMGRAGDIEAVGFPDDRGITSRGRIE
jgi:hypothetical protein